MSKWHKTQFLTNEMEGHTFKKFIYKQQICVEEAIKITYFFFLFVIEVQMILNLDGIIANCQRKYASH